MSSIRITSAELPPAMAVVILVEYCAGTCSGMTCTPGVRAPNCSEILSQTGFSSAVPKKVKRTRAAEGRARPGPGAALSPALGALPPVVCPQAASTSAAPLPASEASARRVAGASSGAHHGGASL